MRTKTLIMNKTNNNNYSSSNNNKKQLLAFTITFFSPVRSPTTTISWRKLLKEQIIRQQQLHRRHLQWRKRGKRIVLLQWFLSVMRVSKRSLIRLRWLVVFFLSFFRFFSAFLFSSLFSLSFLRSLFFALFSYFFSPLFSRLTFLYSFFTLFFQFDYVTETVAVYNVEIDRIRYILRITNTFAELLIGGT